MSDAKVPVKWANIYAREPDGPTGEGGGRIIPPHVRRKLAKASKAGGRAFCEGGCNEVFSLEYMTFCEVGLFKRGYVCADCRKEHGFRRVS